MVPLNVAPSGPACTARRSNHHTDNAVFRPAQQPAVALMSSRLAPSTAPGGLGLSPVGAASGAANAAPPPSFGLAPATCVPPSLADVARLDAIFQAFARQTALRLWSSAAELAGQGAELAQRMVRGDNKRLRCLRSVAAACIPR